MGMKRIDPPRSFTPEKAQQWFKFYAAVANAFDGTGLSNTLYVDVGGDDDTAEPGSIAFKYSTIQAALDAAQPGDSVVVGPGTFAESLAWPETQSLSLIGSGIGNTTIQPAAGDAIAITPTTGVLGTARIANLSMLVIEAAAYGIDANGVAQPTSFTGSLEVYDCAISNVAGTGGIRCVTVNTIDFQRLSIPSDYIVLEEVGGGKIVHCSISSVTADYDPTDTEPSGGRLIVNVQSSDFSLTMDKLAWFDCDRGCAVYAPTTTLTDDATRWGHLRLGGTIIAGGQFGFEFVNGSSHYGFDLDNSSAEGSGEIHFTESGLSTSRCKATARFAQWSYGVSALEVQDKCDLDIRNGTYPEELPPTVTGDGTIDRSSWFIDEAQGDLAALHAISAAEFGPPLPAGTTEYTITAAEAVIGDQPIDLVTGQVKAAQTFNRTKTADAGTVRYLVTRPD